MIIRYPMTSFPTFAACLFSASLATAPGMASGGEPVPESRWEVDYGRTKCRLIRHFTVADQPYQLEVESDRAFGGQRWALHGPALPVYFSATPIEIALDPRAGVHRFKTLANIARDTDDKAVRWHDADGLLLDTLRDNQRVRLTGPKKLDVALGVPKVRSAIAALEACENDLLKSWGSTSTNSAR